MPPSPTPTTNQSPSDDRRPKAESPNPEADSKASSRTPAFSPAGGGISPTTNPSHLTTDDQKAAVPVPPCDACGESSSAQSSDDAEIVARAARVKSNIRNILLASPYFPRFYADIILRYSPNSNEAKILRPHYQKICEKVNHIMSQNGTCTHIKVTGVRCGSPALHGEEFCYFHQNAHRTVRRPKQSRLHPIALIEDEESIQYSLMEVINALMRNTIDLKRAALILRALHIAVKNATRVKYNIHSKDMVTNIPKYAEPPTEEDFGQTSETELPAVAANPNLPVSLEGPHYWEMQAEAARRVARDESLRFAAEAKSRDEARRRFAEERAQEARSREEWNQAVATTTHVGTAAIGCPAKPQASASVGADAFVRPAPSSEARGRVPTAEITTKPATPAELPSHTFNHPSQPPPAQSRPASRGVPSNSAPPRKQPQSVFHAPKGRKNGAHSARRG